MARSTSAAVGPSLSYCWLVWKGGWILCWMGEAIGKDGRTVYRSFVFLFAVVEMGKSSRGKLILLLRYTFAWSFMCDSLFLIRIRMCFTSCNMAEGFSEPRSRSSNNSSWSETLLLLGHYNGEEGGPRAPSSYCNKRAQLNIQTTRTELS